MKVALFGGAFDPPHRGHQRVGLEVLKRGVVDEIWYVPVYEHPWQERLAKYDLAPYQDRVAMTRLILPSGAKLKEYRDVSYAYKTLKHFQTQFPQAEFSWIIGSEYLPSFGDWHLADKILAEFTVYVYPRKKWPLQPLLPGMEALEDFPTIKASSTLVKKKLRRGEEVKELLSEEILTYLQKNGLY